MFFPLFFLNHSLPQILSDLAELSERGLKVVDDFPGKDAGVGKVVGFFQAFVFEPEDVEAGFVPADEFIVFKGPPSAAWFLFRPGGFTFVSVMRIVALTNSSRSERFNGFVLRVKCVLVRRS
ncbi:MAG: hypothetical protein R6U29_12490 [Desulfosudaceae bacterium]